MARHGENIYKRKDGRYEGRYVIGRNPNGTTKFGYVFGRQYSDVRTRLMQKKAEFLSDRSNGHSGGTIRLTEWGQRWMQTEVMGSVKSSSYQTYCTVMNRHLLPELGAYELNAITPAVLREFLGRLQERQLAVSTIRSIFRLLSSCLNSALEEGMISRNPCKRLKLPSEHRRMQRVLTIQEQEMISHSRETDRLPALISLYTGMRLGEICALKWTDINWHNSTISVSRTAQRVKRIQTGGLNKTMLMIGAPKSFRSQRILPVPEFLVNLLKEYLKFHTGEEFIFGRENRAAEPRTIQRKLQLMLKKLGIAGAHFHTLRHTFATRLLEIGIDIKTVSVLLGHESAKTTLDFYAHSLIDRQRSAIERLAALNG